MRLHRVLDEALSIRLGFNFDDYVLLQTLSSENATEMLGLATRLGYTRMGLLNKVRPLEKIGLLSSEGSVSQRRVSLTPAGQRALNIAQNIVADDSAVFFGEQDLGGALSRVGNS